MNYRMVLKKQEIAEYIGNSELLALDIETSPKSKYRDDEKASLDAHKSTITGISFSVSKGTGIYVPFRHKVGRNADFMDIWSWIQDNILMNENLTLVIHNAAFETMFFYALGCVPQCKIYDTLAAAQLTLKTSTEFRKLGDSGLKKLVPELLKVELPTFSEVVSQAKRLKIPGELECEMGTGSACFDELDSQNPETIRYACADSDYALRLYHVFNDWFDANLPKHRFIVEQIESPTAVYCGLMKYNGILMNVDFMRQKQKELTDVKSQLKEDIELLTGAIDIGKNAGTKEFKKYLYEQLNLPVLKRTNAGAASVDDEAILLLEEYCKTKKPDIYPLFAMIREYRNMDKIMSTYINGFLKYCDTQTNKIHSNFWQLGAESGRFSCRNPNFQNLKAGIYSDFNVRDFVIAPENKSIIEADYSQVELKIAAYLSQDEVMIGAYKQCEDIHAVTTSAVFKISVGTAKDKSDPNYKKRRTVAKSTIFGVLYGIYKNGLKRNLKVSAGIDLTDEECEDFITGLKTRFYGLASWQKRTVAIDKENGYIETKIGRRRYLPSINSVNFKNRSSDERVALNHGVQGLAAECLKLSMARLVKELPRYQYLTPILTVHDSLVFICPDEKVSEAAELIKKCMEIAPFPDFDIPLNVEVSAGKSYGKLKEIEVT